jgi:hypothetical protein
MWLSDACAVMHCGSKSAAHELPIIRVLQMGSGSILKFILTVSCALWFQNTPHPLLLILLNTAGAPESNACAVLIKIRSET